MSSDGTNLIADVYGGRLYISTNGGSSWAETQPAGDLDKNWYTTSMSSDGTKLIAGAKELAGDYIFQQMGEAVGQKHSQPGT